MRRLFALRERIAHAWADSLVFRAAGVVFFLAIFLIGAVLLTLLLPFALFPVAQLLWVLGLAAFAAWLTVPDAEVP
jgi:hypothetical protein